MSKKIRKGMVLCAGLGTRLLPITEQFPKPIVPVLNVPNLLHSLFLLERAGIEEVVVNLHHLPQKIENFIRNTPGMKLKLSYSKEPTLLGTGGGLKKAEAFFEGEPFVLANCDFVSNVDLRPMMEHHLERRAMATMVLVEDPEMQRHYSKVGITTNSNLCSLPSCEVAPPKKTGIFTGLHILSPTIFKHLKEVPSGINEVLYPALMKQSPERVYGDFMTGYWYDTGDLFAYGRATLKLLDALKKREPLLTSLLQSYGNHYVEKSAGIWLSEGAQLPGSDVKTQGPLLLGKGCTFGKGVVLGPYCVLGDNVALGAGTQASQTVFLSGSQTSENQEFKEGIVFQDLFLPARRPA